MNEVKGRSRPSLFGLIAVATAIALTGVFAACGDDDGESADPASLAIEATGAEGSLRFEAPAEADAGATEIAFTNSSELEELDSQLVYTAEDHSDQEVVAEIAKANRGEPVADWFEGGGGPGTSAPGETTTVTQELRAGTYYVLGGEGEPTTPLTRIEVGGDDGAEAPEADSTVTAEDYSFAADGLKAGRSTVRLENAGQQWHHFIAAKLKPGATIEEVRNAVGSERPPQGPTPFEEEFAIQSTVLEGGSSQLVDVDLEPGGYAFFCFISDKAGGPPHVAKGMVSEITVEE